MTIKEYNLLLIQTFPELVAAFYSETNWQDDCETGCHVVYGDIFVPFIESAILNHDIVTLNRIFIFIEKLLLTKVKYIEEVMTFSVLEKLYDKPDQLQRSLRFMGSATLAVINELH